MRTALTILPGLLTALFLLPAIALAGGSKLESKVTYQFEEYTGKVTFTWDVPTKVKTQTTDRELLLTFGRPFNAETLDPLMKHLPDWIESVSTGFDTVLFRTTYDTKFDVVDEGMKTAVFFSPDIRTVSKTYPPNVQMRLQLLEARLLAETGQTDEAIDKLKTLREEHPRNARPLMALAETENSFGRWRRAYGYLRQAEKLAPENEDIDNMRAGIERQHDPRVKLDYEWRQTDDDDHEHKVRAEGHEFIQPFTRVGGSYDINFASAEDVLRADGRVGDFNATRHQAEIYVRHDSESGVMTKGSLYFGEDSLGAGALYSFVNDWGQTGLYAEWRRPNWDFIEGVLDNATRDRIGLLHDARLAHNLDLGLGLAANRYNVNGDDDVMETVSLEGSLRYPLYFGPPLLTIGYILDAEYRTSVNERVDAFGNRYTPYPLETREVHFLDLALRHAFEPTLVFEGFVGYGYDRLGGSGPSIGASLTRWWEEGGEVQIRASRTLNASESGEDINIAGGYFLWRF